MVEVARGDSRHLERLFARHAGRFTERNVLHFRHETMFRGLASAAHINWLFGAIFSPICPRQHNRAARIRHQTDVQQVERIEHRTGIQHVLYGDGIAEFCFRVQARPFTRRNRDIRPLFQRRAMFVHVTVGDHAEISRRAAKAVGRFVLTHQAGVACPRHASARTTAFAVRDDRHVAQTMV